MFDEFSVGYANIGSAFDGIPIHVLLEGFFQLEVAHIVASGIVVQKSVEADALDRSHEASGRREWLQTTAGADAHHCERAMLVALCASGIVDVGQCVELVCYDVDVVASYAVTLACDAFAFIGAGNGVELSTAHFALLGVEVMSYGVNSCRVAHQDDTVGQLFGT